MQDMTKESLATFIVTPIMVVSVYSGSFWLSALSGYAAMTISMRLLRGVIHNAKIEAKFLKVSKDNRQ